ncbi:MAG: AraC family transcriptional regulator, partial [Clostridia bacterium]|nr:AraC family transcriptional regulator [Clostridia bacterium]
QFKNYFGMSPYQYILQCRINKATLLLLQGKDVDIIIKDCGFGTPTNFYRRFKNMTGMTPAKFLKLNS